MKSFPRIFFKQRFEDGLIAATVPHHTKTDDFMKIVQAITLQYNSLFFNGKKSENFQFPPDKTESFLEFLENFQLKTMNCTRIASGLPVQSR